MASEMINPSTTPVRSTRVLGVATALTVCYSALVGCRGPVDDGEPNNVKRRTARSATAPKCPADRPVTSLVPVRWRVDGKPAVPTPHPRDKRWRDTGYAPLAPSRTDGKPTFSNNWFDINVAHWSKVLAPLRGKRNLRYLEVGVYEGRSLLWLFEHVLTDESSRAVVVDIFEHAGLLPRLKQNLARAKISDQVEIRKGYSNVVLRGLTPDSFNLIYIDASHLGADVLRDTVLAWDLLRVGGLLMLDDYAYVAGFADELRPKPAIDAFITAFRDEVEVLHRGWQVVLRKRQDPCPGYCSTLGPYQYHWNWRKPTEVGSLFDPRTSARVPLSSAELRLVERLLKARPYGTTQFFLSTKLTKSAALGALRRKLDI